MSSTYHVRDRDASALAGGVAGAWRPPTEDLGKGLAGLLAQAFVIVVEPVPICSVPCDGSRLKQPTGPC